MPAATMYSSASAQAGDEPAFHALCRLFREISATGGRHCSQPGGEQTRRPPLTPSPLSNIERGLAFDLVAAVSLIHVRFLLRNTLQTVTMHMLRPVATDNL
jgi:hypothetical protein